MIQNEEELEKEITKLCAETANFRLTKSGATCLICGKRFQQYRIGLPLNESMLKHFQTRHTKKAK